MLGKFQFACMNAKTSVAIVWTLFATCVQSGDVVDLGTSKTVPDWAIGPLLVVSIEQFHTEGFNFTRKATKRIGTIQSNYRELSGKRYRLSEIGLSEISNDSHQCHITTTPDAGIYYEIRLSQRLFDQTYYYVYIEKMDPNKSQAVEKQNFVVWDIKSRKWLGTPLQSSIVWEDALRLDAVHTQPAMRAYLRPVSRFHRPRSPAWASRWPAVP